MATPGKTNDWGPVVWLGAVIFGGIWIFGGFKCGGAESKPETAKASTPDEPEIKHHDIGYEGKLKGALVADSEIDMDELVKFATAKDEIGLNQMVGDGKVWSADDGTKAKLLNVVFRLGDNLLDVRIESGPHLGEEGWIGEKCLE